MPAGDFHILDGNDWHLMIDAARGGQIVDCTWRGHSVFTRAPAGLWPEQALAGCFALVPYSNRIRNGALRFAGRTIRLDTPGFAAPHALHGLGWRRAWTCCAPGPGEMTLVHTEAGTGWPWPYEACQRFSVVAGRLAMTLSVRNTGTEVMPAGIGFHPFFPRRPGIRISLTAEGVWTTDPADPGLPEAWCALDPGANVFDKPLDALDLDNCFTGWNGLARLDYPDTDFSIELIAEPVFGNVVIYCPAGKNILCVEPVSHVNDAASLPGLDPRQRLARLEPGETLSGTVILRASGRT